MRVLLVVVIAAGALSGCGRAEDEAAKSAGKQLAATVLSSDEYKKDVARRIELLKKEEATVEVADWFGKTGLPEGVERHVPRYLRREFGESLFDANSLKAADLVYEGAFDENEKRVHYWRIPRSSGKVSYAYVITDRATRRPEGTGWGSKAPAIAK